MNQETLLTATYFVILLLILLVFYGILRMIKMEERLSKISQGVEGIAERLGKNEKKKRQ